MLRYDGDRIEITRGDACTITIKCTSDRDDDIFHVNDKIQFAVYKKKELNKQPVLYKEVTINQDTKIVDIPLSSSDTKIGEMSNKPIDYWYEIQLNKECTLVGYDRNGEKVLRLYPEGADLE